MRKRKILLLKFKCFLRSLRVANSILGNSGQKARGKKKPQQKNPIKGKKIPQETVPRHKMVLFHKTMSNVTQAEEHYYGNIHMPLRNISFSTEYKRKAENL